MLWLLRPAIKPVFFGSDSIYIRHTSVPLTTVSVLRHLVCIEQVKSKSKIELQTFAAALKLRNFARTISFGISLSLNFFLNASSRTAILESSAVM